jgi:hypothetical protein
MSELNETPKGPKRIIIQMDMPPITFETSAEDLGDNMRHWLFEYASNIILALPGSKFTFDNGVKTEAYHFDKLMAASINNEHTRRDTIKNKLRLAETSGKIEL